MDSSMPVQAGPGNTLLVWLGRVLPKEFVRRVAEPALSDEVSRWSEAGAVPLLARTRFVCSCLWVGVPRIFWDRRRPTNVTVALLGTALVLFVALVLWARTVYQDMPGGGP